jgi:hypothetical protein
MARAALFDIVIEPAAVKSLKPHFLGRCGVDWRLRPPSSTAPKRPSPSSALWLQVLKHSSSSFPSQAMHPPPPAQGPPPEGRDWRGRKTMEETMQVLTINDLMRLTRIELCNLVQRITDDLSQFAEGSPERTNALTSLRNIRYLLARRDYTARMGPKPH